MWVVIKRYVSLSALLLSSVPLTACGGSGGGFSANTLAANGGVRTVNDTSDACKGTVDDGTDPVDPLDPVDPVDPDDIGGGTPVGSNSTRLAANGDGVF